MKRRLWTDADMAVLRALYPNVHTVELAHQLGRPVQSVYGQAQKHGIGKTPEYLKSEAAGRICAGVNNPKMMVGRFKAGQQAWNKGLHYVAGGRSADTRFKTGQTSRRWDPAIYCVGALRMTTDGVLMMKVAPDGGRHSWQILARWVWEQAHGPIPSKHVVRAKNGDAHDTRLENLELLSMTENARRNSVWTKYPREVAALVQLKGAITRVVNRISQEDASS